MVLAAFLDSQDLVAYLVFLVQVDIAVFLDLVEYLDIQEQAGTLGLAVYLDTQVLAVTQEYQDFLE